MLWLSIFFNILIVGVMVKFAFGYAGASAARTTTHNVRRDRMDRGAIVALRGFVLDWDRTMPTSDGSGELLRG